MENKMMQLINSRRSVRAFKDDPISEKDIREILEAGMNAPSAANEQAWQFVVMTDPAIRKEYAAFNKNVPSISQSPAAILVCGDLGREKFKGLHVQDCSAASENILLAIHAKGLGGFWGYVFPESVDGVKKLLNLPDDIIPFSIIPFGYSQKPIDPKPQTRFDEARIHMNGW
jgi:nitroreductase